MRRLRKQTHTAARDGGLKKRGGLEITFEKRDIRFYRVAAAS